MSKFSLFLLLLLTVPTYSHSNEKLGVEQPLLRATMTKRIATSYFEGVGNISLTLITRNDKNKPTEINLSFNTHPDCVKRSICPSVYQETHAFRVYNIERDSLFGCVHYSAYEYFPNFLLSAFDSPTSPRDLYFMDWSKAKVPDTFLWKVVVIQKTVDGIPLFNTKTMHTSYLEIVGNPEKVVTTH